MCATDHPFPSSSKYLQKQKKVSPSGERSAAILHRFPSFVNMLPAFFFSTQCTSPFVVELSYDVPKKYAVCILTQRCSAPNLASVPKISPVVPQLMRQFFFTESF
jgi:hypothetical protein